MSSHMAEGMSMDLGAMCSALHTHNGGNFEVCDFLTDSTTPESGIESMAYAVTDGTYSLDAWTSTQFKAEQSRLRLLAEDDMSYDGGDTLTQQPKKARRQAQNRAAQRAFRERKEKYIHELETRVAKMRVEISILEKDRSRFESALKVAQAEIDTLRSMPAQSCSHSRHDGQRSEVACQIDGFEGRHSIVLTLDFNLKDVSIHQQTSDGNGG